MQSNQDQNDINSVPWKLLLVITAESILAFFIASFCMAMFITHHGQHWIAPALILGILYLFIIIVVFKRVLQKLPVAAVMLIIPIAPFIALMLIISMIPILQKIM